MLSIELRMAMIVAKTLVADPALQARSASLKDAIIIIKCVQDGITNLRLDEMYNQILHEAESFTSSDSENAADTQKRQARTFKRMDDNARSIRFPT